jgi:uncharacterized membrane protein YfcA
MLFYILVAFCVVFEILGIYVVRKQYKLKVDSNYQITPGDLEGSTKELASLSMLLFVSAVTVTFCGASPTGVVIPILLYNGVEPRVSIATGVFLAMLNTMSATVLMIFF